MSIDQKLVVDNLENLKQTVALTVVLQIVLVVISVLHLEKFVLTAGSLIISSQCAITRRKIFLQPKSGRSWS